MQTWHKQLRWLGMGSLMILINQTVLISSWQWLLGQLIYRMRYPVLSRLMWRWDLERSWLPTIGLLVSIMILWPGMNWLSWQLWRWFLGTSQPIWRQDSNWNWWRLGWRIGWWSWLVLVLVRLNPANHVDMSLLMVDLIQHHWWYGVIAGGMIIIISVWFITHPMTNLTWPWRWSGWLLLGWWLMMLIGGAILYRWPVNWLAAGLIWWGQFSALLGVSLVVGQYLVPNPQPITGKGIGIYVALIVVVGGWLTLPTQALMQPRTNLQIIAHRGVNQHDGAQNTLPAFYQTQRVHPDWVEIDLHRTRDNHWVVFHDESLHPLTKLSGFPRQYRQDQLVGLTIHDQGRKGQLVSFEQYLKSAQHVHQPLIIELKTTPADSATQIRRFIQRYGTMIKARGDLIHTMDYQALQTMQQTDPHLKLLSIQGYAVMLPAQWPGGYTMEAGTLTSSWLQMAHRQHQRVYAWTVNQPLMVRPLLALGVDGIVTDQTTSLRREIQKIKAEPAAWRQFRQYLWGI